jgi:hypothetical protein
LLLFYVNSINKIPIAAEPRHEAAEKFAFFGLSGSENFNPNLSLWFVKQHAMILTFGI